MHIYIYICLHVHTSCVGMIPRTILSVSCVSTLSSTSRIASRSACATESKQMKIRSGTVESGDVFATVVSTLG